LGLFNKIIPNSTKDKTIVIKRQRNSSQYRFIFTKETF